MDKRIVIGIGVGVSVIGIALLYHFYKKPINDRKKLIQLFIDKNYTAVSEQLTSEELQKLQEAIFDLTEAEQKTLLNAYENSSDKNINMDELRRILDKLHPVMDAIKPAFDITRIELGKKQIYLHIKNAVEPNIIFTYGTKEPVTMQIPLTDAPVKDGKALMVLKFAKGKLAAFEEDKKIQEEEIIEPKPIVNQNNKQQK